MQPDDQCLVALESFIHLLDKGQAAKETAHPINQNGVVIS